MDISVKRLNTALSMSIEIFTQSGVGTPLIFIVISNHYNTKRVTKTTCNKAFISDPPQHIISSISA